MEKKAEKVGILRVHGQEILEQYGLEINEENLFERLSIGEKSMKRDVTFVVTENPIFKALVTARSIQQHAVRKSSLGECSAFLPIPGKGDVILFCPSVAKANLARLTRLSVERQSEEDTKWILERYMNRTVEVYAAMAIDMEGIGKGLSRKAIGSFMLTMGGAVLAVSSVLLDKFKHRDSVTEDRAVSRLALMGIGALAMFAGLAKNVSVLIDANKVVKIANDRADRYTKAVIEGDTEDELISYVSAK